MRGLVTYHEVVILESEGLKIFEFTIFDESGDFF